MKTKVHIMIWLAALVLLGLILPPLSTTKPKARAARVHAVNNIASTFPKTIVLTNVSTPLPLPSIP